LSPDSLVNRLRSAWKRAESKTSAIARALMNHRLNLRLSLKCSMYMICSSIASLKNVVGRK
jgi:hypothetical protein